MTDHEDMCRQRMLENRHQRMRGLIFGGKQLWVVLILGAVGLTALVVFGSMKTASSTASSTSLSTFTARRDDLTIRWTGRKPKSWSSCAGAMRRSSRQSL